MISPASPDITTAACCYTTPRDTILLGYLVLAWDAIRWLLEWPLVRRLLELANMGQAIDFALEHWEHPGWLGNPWIELSAVLIGVGLIILDRRHPNWAFKVSNRQMIIAGLAIIILGVIVVATGVVRSGPDTGSHLTEAAPVSGASLPSEKFIPDLRLANNPTILDLFSGAHQHEILALITTGRLTTWAKEREFNKSNSYSADFTRLSKDDWRDYTLSFFPREENGRTPQTYLVGRNDEEPIWDDIYFSSAQLSEVLSDKYSGLKQEDVRFVFDLVQEPLLWGEVFIPYDGANYFENGISIKGTNVSDREIALQKAMLVSGINGVSMELHVETLDRTSRTVKTPVNQIYPITPGADVTLAVDFGENGISPDEFLQKWGTFIFTVTYLDKERRYRFEKSDVLKLLSKQHPDFAPSPHVEPKSAK